MKKISSLIITVMVCFSIGYASGPNLRVNKLDRQVEILLDSAARHMLNFILTQNETEYYASLQIAKDASELNNQIIINFDKIRGLARRVECSILEDREEEFLCYSDESLNFKIMKEDNSERKIKVKFKGQIYLLSKESKMLFDCFITYLPRN